MTTYYINYTGGSDTNNGTSTSTAWQHCPGDPNATSHPSSTTLSAGTTVIFMGGVNYIGQITVNGSGSAGNPIILDGNSAGTWGTGQAILNGNYVNGAVGITVISKNYITIQNFEVCYFGAYTSAQLSEYHCIVGGTTLPDIDGTGMVFQNVTYVTIQNCYFHQIGILQNSAPVNGDSDISGTGIMVYSGNNIIITNNNFTMMSQPINLSTIANFGGSSNTNLTQITVSYNNIHNYIRWLICIGAGADNSVMQDINIFGNQLHDYPEYDGTLQTFCLNDTDTPHDDGIILFVATSNEAGTQNYTNCTLGTPAHPLKIYNNWFYNDNITSGGGTAYIFLTQWGGTVYVYNNIFLNSHPQDQGGEGNIYVQDGLLATDNNPAVDYHFWNNTFYDTQTAFQFRSMTPGYDLNRSGYALDLRNNIMYNADTIDYNFQLLVIEADNDTTGATPSFPTIMDYNLYYVIPGNYADAGSANQIISVSYDQNHQNPWYSISEFRTAYGTSYEPHGNYSDPKFVNLSYSILTDSSDNLGSCTSNNYQLQLSSPAINAGVNLTSLGISTLNVDASGNSRPSSGAWTIGAFNYTTPSIETWFQKKKASFLF